MEVMETKQKQGTGKYQPSATSKTARWRRKAMLCRLNLLNCLQSVSDCWYFSLHCTSGQTSRSPPLTSPVVFQTIWVMRKKVMRKKPCAN